jgi:hypothetical protein
MYRVKRINSRAAWKQKQYRRNFKFLKAAD